jgi:hypothetical protein
MEECFLPVRLAILALFAMIAFKLYATSGAAKPAQLWPPSCVASVPESWGQFKGGNPQAGIAFEDNTGTLRFVTNIPCGGTPLIALEVRRSGNVGGN